MAYGVIMCCHLHMPLYILGTFTEYPYVIRNYFIDKKEINTDLWVFISFFQLLLN